MSKVINAADLFCGAGGTTNGLKDAAQELDLDVSLVAVNHWDIAIATIKKNHPDVVPKETGVQDVDPRSVVPDGHLDILVASPECTFFSRARGGRPISDQQRISPWLVLDWLEKLDVSNVLIENVPELQKWGPVGQDGKPIKRLVGRTFQAYIKTIRSLGYFVSWKVLNCANYGDATTRERLFIMARKGKRVRWPEPTHINPKKLDGPQIPMFNHVRPWKPAWEIIDWSKPGTSIYARKRPLSENTLRRIEAGLRKFSGLPFVIGQQSGAAPRSVEDPIPTVAGAGAISLIQPYLLKFYGTSDVSGIDEPLPTITAKGNHLGVCQPFLVPYRSERDGQEPRTHSLDEPLPTVSTINGFGLAQPFVLNIRGGNDGYLRGFPVSEPMQTVTGHNPMALIQPFLISYYGASNANSIEDPLPTITAQAEKHALIQPFLVETIHGKDWSRAYPLSEPMKTITSVDAWALAQPYLVQYNGTSKARSVDEPLPTQTTKDRFGLAQPMFFKIQGQEQLYMLDILFRMLFPSELAAAMSFPKSYKFHGKREDVVKQIGNAVPRKTAKALCKALLS